MTRSEPRISANGQASLKDRVRELQLSSRLEGGKSPKSGSSTAWLPWLLCILMALVWAGWGIRAYKTSGGNGPAPATGGEAAAPKKPASETGKAAAAGEIVLESKGYLIPSHSISVSPIDVAGRITVLNIEEGLTFKEGQVLAVIDSTPLRRRQSGSRSLKWPPAAKFQTLSNCVTSTELEIKQAEFELAEARAQQAEALVVWETAKSTASGAVAKLEITQANKKFDAAAEHVKALEIKLTILKGEPRKQRIVAAEREMEASEARLVRAQWSFDNCTIRSPVTGVILTKKAEIGSLINPVVGGVSTSLCEIADLNQMEVDLEIQERDIAKLRVGMICRVRPDAYSENVYIRGYYGRPDDADRQPGARDHPRSSPCRHSSQGRAGQIPQAGNGRIGHVRQSDVSDAVKWTLTTCPSWRPQRE